LERAIILSSGPVLEIDAEVFGSLPKDGANNAGSLSATDGIAAPPSPGEIRSRSIDSLEANERNHILAALKQTDWVIDGPRGAAKILALHPNTLRSRMKKLGIPRASREGSQVARPTPS